MSGQSMFNQIKTAASKFTEGAKSTVTGLHKTALENPHYAAATRAASAAGNAAATTARQAAAAAARQRNAYLATPAGMKAANAAAKTVTAAKGLSSAATSAAKTQLNAARKFVQEKTSSSNASKLQQSLGETCRLCKQVCKMNGGAIRRKRNNRNKSRGSKKY